MAPFRLQLLLDALAQLFANALQHHADRGAAAGRARGDLFGRQVFEVAPLHDLPRSACQATETRLQHAGSIESGWGRLVPLRRELLKQRRFEAQQIAGRIATMAEHLKLCYAQSPTQEGTLLVVLRKPAKQDERRFLEDVFGRRGIADHGANVSGNGGLGRRPEVHEPFLFVFAQHGGEYFREQGRT